jgi:hypothetical protein
VRAEKLLLVITIGHKVYSGPIAGMGRRKIDILMHSCNSFVAGYAT